MKKNQGFTLIEVMIMTVLAILLTIYTLPKILQLLDTSKDELYKTQVKMIEKAAKDYYVKEINDLPTQKKDARFLTIKDLVDHHDLDTKEILDPRTNKQMNGCVIVKTSGKNYQYTYVEETCNQAASSYLPKIKIEKVKQTVEVNETYSFPKATAKDILGEDLPVVGPYVHGELMTKLDTSTVGKKIELEYQARDEKRHIVGQKKVQIEVVDTTPPQIKVNGKTKSFTYEQPMDAKELEKFNVECTDNSKDPVKLKVTSTVSQVHSKGTVTYLAKDSSGNISALVVTVKQVDTKNPLILKVDGNRKQYKQTPVILTVSKEKHLGNELQYSFDGGKNWQEENYKEIPKNNKIEIQTKDMFGHTSSIWTEEVTTVDSNPPHVPTVTLTVDHWLGKEYDGSWTNKNVYVQLHSKDQESFVDFYEYSVDGTHFKKMDTTMIFQENMKQTYYFRSVDAAGNRSALTKGVHIQIDKQNISVPQITLETNTGHQLTPGKKVWTSGEIYIKNITTTKDTGSHIAFYEVSKDDKYSYTEAQPTYLFNEHMKETYYFRSVDEAGNKSGWTKPIYLYIDRIRPSVPQVTLKLKNKKGLTYQSGTTVHDPIYMKVLSVDNGSGIDYYQWSIDGSVWETLEKDEKIFTENMNSKVFVRAVDKVGNVSFPYEMHFHIQR